MDVQALSATDDAHHGCRLNREEVCDVPECGRVVYAKSLCFTHGLRFRRFGNVGGSIVEKASDPKVNCRADDCLTLVLRRSPSGLCKVHYRRFKKTGDFTAIKKPFPCSVCGGGRILAFDADEAMHEECIAGKKKCKKCNIIQPLDNFRRTPNGAPVVRCNACRSIQLREAGYKARYGIDLQTYELMVERQNGMCALCDLPPSGTYLLVDHNHTTGAVRSLLCETCNVLVGYVENYQILIPKALQYIQ